MNGFMLLIGGFVLVIVIGVVIGAAFSNRRNGQGEGLDHRREGWERRQRTSVLPGPEDDGVI
jgi:hypothetical protein